MVLLGDQDAPPELLDVGEVAAGHGGKRVSGSKNDT